MRKVSTLSCCDLKRLVTTGSRHPTPCDYSRGNYLARQPETTKNFTLALARREFGDIKTSDICCIISPQFIPKAKAPSVGVHFYQTLISSYLGFPFLNGNDNTRSAVSAFSYWVNVAAAEVASRAAHTMATAYEFSTTSANKHQFHYKKYAVITLKVRA